MHFGLYLKNKGIISAEQLVEALEAQLTTLPPIGQLALEEGILSPREIFEVLVAQSQSPTERFGEIAIGMGFMTRDELMRLLMIQADRKRPVSELLVVLGILTEDHVAAEMMEYRKSLAKQRSARARASMASAPRGQHCVLRMNESTTLI